MIDNSINVTEYEETLKYIHDEAKQTLLSKFNSLSKYYDIYTSDNPIEYIKGRVKDPESIKEKIERKKAKNLGQNLSTEGCLKQIKDIVGVRIVCSFLSDVDKIIQFINKDPEITVLYEKNYIKNPKPDSEYRSYHMIVQIDVTTGLVKVPVIAEIQIRTLVMDMQASLDHKYCYKKSNELLEEQKTAIKAFNHFSIEMDTGFDQMITRLKSERRSLNQKPITEISDGDYQRFIYKYERALEYIQNKIYTISGEFERTGVVNPIEHIKGRIKEKDKMLLKMEARNPNQAFDIETLENSINDIAGIRIVCSFLSDLPTMIEILKSEKELIFIDEKEKDYISNPKPSGYRGYHLLAMVPIHFTTGTIYVKVEIILQTIAMAVWDSAEHKLCYKKQENEEFQSSLRFISEKLKHADQMMNEIYLNSLEQQKEKHYTKERKKPLLFPKRKPSNPEEKK